MKFLTIILGIFGLLTKGIPIVVAFVQDLVAKSFKLIDDLRDMGAQPDVIAMEQQLARERIVNAAKHEFSGSPHVIPEPIIRVIVEVAVYKEKAKRDEKKEKAREKKAVSKGYVEGDVIDQIKKDYPQMFGK